MEQRTNSLLVLTSGIIMLVISALNIISWIILYAFLRSMPTPPAFLLPFLEHFMDYLKNPLEFVFVFVLIALGIFFVVASKKMEIPEKSYHWSVLSLVVGLIIIFELHGGSVFGGISIGILSASGGALGLYDSIKRKSNLV